MATLLKYEDFVRQLNSKFRVVVDDTLAEEFELVEVSDLTGGTDHSRFSVIFRGPLDPFLNQGMRSFENAQMGEFDLFIVPIRKDEKGISYEAIFNRLSPGNE